MDEIVQAAMKKWPDVPAVFHWLSLDGRGRWRLKGELVSNPVMIAFLNRNYDHDRHGRWFVQNGPQRVFVSLEAAPWIVHIDNALLVTQTGKTVLPRKFLIDEDGHLYTDTASGLAKIDDRELTHLSDSILETNPDRLALRFSGRQWPIETVARSELPRVFGFDPDPCTEAPET